MYENRREVLYVVVIRDLYGIIVEYLLLYKKHYSDIEDIGFVLNPYEPFCYQHNDER